jgi:hypothetical protein
MAGFLDPRPFEPADFARGETFPTAHALPAANPESGITETATRRTTRSETS